ncbi:TRAP transporter large permease [Marinibacterium sp. SX1]|uniref:TRAP transporter large permease n=1 Tax=Marinibacterium sp. SX1 TaxID=3388424 RepID=UPI003D16666A
MIDLPLIAVGFGLMLGLMALGLHIGVVMFGMGFLGAFLYLGAPGTNAMVVVFLGSMNDSVLLQLPLFILLGEILVRCGATGRMYRSLADWLNPIPGGLLHTNIAASAMFATVSGSALATAATVSKVSLPTFRERNYDARYVLGSIAAGGSLGNLIPPGIAFILFGVLTNTSIARLYAAGVVPGLALAVAFSLTIVALTLWRPSIAPKETGRAPLSQRLARLKDLVPSCIIFATVMGSIYSGWATSTEAAALAVVVAMAIAAGHGKLSIPMLHEAFVSTVSLTGLMMLILSGAFALNFVLGLLGVTAAITQFVSGLDVTPVQFLYILLVFYLIMGMFFETLPMLVGTLPLIFPAVLALGVDPVWFGVFMVMMCEIALISPPVGMVLYVIQAVRGEGSIGDVFRGVIPFLVTLLAMTALLIHQHKIALWLPDRIFQ